MVNQIAWIRATTLVGFIIAILLCPSLVFANKSGVSPNVLNLPTGPGSIDGLGESFQAQSNSGTGSYRLPLKFPPGRSGLTPDISFLYAGGGGNSELGIGWKLSIPYVQRQTDKGLPTYVQDQDIYVIENGEILVKTPDGFYRQKNHPDFARYESVLDEQNRVVSWVQWQADGTKYYFGQGTDSTVGSGDYPFRWMLKKIVDRNSNIIEFSYRRCPVRDCDPSINEHYLYLDRVGYSKGSEVGVGLHARFLYELRPATDQLTNFRSRFPISQRYRLSQVEMYEGDQPVRKYKLEYKNQFGLSKLHAVEEYGSRASIMPFKTARFEYSSSKFQPSLFKMDLGQPPQNLDLPDLELADMNGDALPDLLFTEHSGHGAYLNIGNGWSEYKPLGSFGGYRLRDTFTLLADLNSDGIVDLLSEGIPTQGSRYGLTFFKGGQGNISDATKLGWENRANRLPVPFRIILDGKTLLADINNDGRIDFIRKTESSNAFEATINSDGEHFSPRLILSSPRALYLESFDSSGSAALKLADMNGDGLQDLVMLERGGRIWYYPAHGVTENDQSAFEFVGWDETPENWPEGTVAAEGHWMSNSPDERVNGDFANPRSFRKLRLVDANGDGLSDLLYIGNRSLQVWLNEGGLQFSKEPWAITPEDLLVPYITENLNIRLADMNGNGSVDILFNRETGFPELNLPNSNWVYLDLFGEQRPNLLTKIENGIGGVTEIQYRPAISYYLEDANKGLNWKYRLPIALNVVDRVIVRDGLGGPPVSKEFKYHHGYYDGAEREFRGFEEVEIHEVGDDPKSTLVTREQYHTGALLEDEGSPPAHRIASDEDRRASEEARKGRLRASYFSNGEGKLYFSEELDWRVFGVPNIEGAPRQARLMKKQRDVLELGAGKPVNIAWDYEYDDYGNPLVVREHGRQDEGWNDERITRTFYTSDASLCDNVDELWILAKPLKQIVTNGSGEKVSETVTRYDGSQTKNGCPVDRANPTQVERWIQGEEYAVTRQSFDSWGNVTAIYDPLYGTKPGHYRTIAYDPRYQTYPVEERIYLTDSEYLTATAEYDPGLGAVIRSTDFNGQSTAYRYDDFGRLVAIVKPGDQFPTLEYEYHLANFSGDVNWVETRRRESSNGGTLDSRQFYDGLGRLIMTRAEGDETGEVVVSDTVQFDARMQPYRKYLPYIEFTDGGRLDYRPPSFMDKHYTEHEYDALSREVRITQPDDSYATTVYEPLVRIVRDEKQTQTQPESPHYGAGIRYEEDGLLDDKGHGRLRLITELTPEPWVTSYRYDVLGNLTGYTDSQGNQKHMQYDGLSRRVFMNDPDRGQMSYVYDRAGNLRETTDAKGQVIRYEVDGANRLREEYHEGLTTPAVSYHYDSAEGSVSTGRLFGHDSDSSNFITPQNLRGQLAWVKDESGEIHFSYDSRGRAEWTVRQINDGFGTVENYYKGIQYDSMDRVSRLVYPDNSYVDYVYNRRGLLKSIPGVIDNYHYNAAGQNKILTLTNGVTTEYEYDDRLRLTAITSTRTADQLKLQALGYQYDAVSNITQITDGRTAKALQTIGTELGVSNQVSPEFNQAQTFQYDPLYRLIEARNDEVYGHITYDYDQIGNMVLKDGGNLTTPNTNIDLGPMSHGGGTGTRNRIGRNPGDAPGPHALTSTTRGPNHQPITLTYDDNGNVTQDHQGQLSWDVKDRLVTYASDKATADYRYDYENMRRVKVVRRSGTESPSIVHYIDKFSEVRDGQLIKYVYAGNNRVASRHGTDTGQTFQPEYFYLYDHLGSTNISLTSTSKVVEQYAYYPYGHPRMPASGAAATNYSFTGKERDGETGMVYFGARYYSSFDQFVSVDPLLLDGSLPELNSTYVLNGYAYSFNRPTVMVDPDGELSVLFTALIGGGLSVGVGYLTQGKDYTWKHGFRDFAVGAAAGAVGAGIFSKAAAIAKLAKTAPIAARLYVTSHMALVSYVGVKTTEVALSGIIEGTTGFDPGNTKARAESLSLSNIGIGILLDMSFGCLEPTKEYKDTPVGNALDVVNAFNKEATDFATKQVMRDTVIPPDFSRDFK